MLGIVFEGTHISGADIEQMRRLQRAIGQALAWWIFFNNGNVQRLLGFVDKMIEQHGSGKPRSDNCNACHHFLKPALKSFAKNLPVSYRLMLYIAQIQGRFMLGRLRAFSLLLLCFGLLCGTSFAEENEETYCNEDAYKGCPLCGCPPDRKCNCVYGEGGRAICHTHWSCSRIYDRGDGPPPCCPDACWGEWLPEDPVLFRPFMADPRQVTLSVGWRFNDNALGKNIIPVSYGDTIAFYRFHNVWPYCGDFQIELEGALWAVFNPLAEEAPLINADYYVGCPLTYAFDRWQFRLRGFHISSHIGDEFLLTHPRFDRKNPSAEYIDFFISHDLTDEIRLYAGLGYIVHQDSSFHVPPFYQEAGFEIRMPRFGFYSYCQQLYGEPIFAVHMRHRADFRKHVDMTYIIGYEFGKMRGLRRRLRAFLEYHDGYSLEGQFCKRATDYLAIRLTYGF